MSGTTLKGVHTGRRSTARQYYEALLLDPALNRLNLMSSVQSHQLRAAVNKVGNSAEAVERELKSAA
jgi:hypothetical protein